MAFEFLKQKKEKIFLGLDIGTEAVKSLILSTQNPSGQDTKALPGGGASRGNSSLERKGGNKKIIILGTGLQYFEKYDIFNGRDFGTDIMKRAILKSIEQAHQSLLFSSAKKELKERAQKQKKWPLLLIPPPNALQGRIISRFFDRENPKEKISKTEEKNINLRVLKAARKEISQRFTREFGILPKDIYWNSLKIIEIKINGYPVSEIRGYEGKNLEFKILAIFSPRYYLENIKRIIGDLKMDILGITHPVENLSNACGEKKKDGIFLDIGGEITQIFLVKDSRLQQMGGFRTGGRTFSQALSEALGIDERDSRILKERYSNKLLSAGVKKRIKDILAQEQKVWYKNLKLKLKEIKPKEFLSSTIYLFGGGSQLPEIQGALEGEAALGDLPISGAPSVGFIYPKDLENIEDTTKGLNNPQYVPSLLMTYYGEENF
jgi:cell division ATPase FtsA